MTKSLNELREKIKSEVQLAARAKAVDFLAEINLAEKNSRPPEHPKPVESVK